MSEKSEKAAKQLSEGKIPENLKFMRDLGEALKNNPKKYEELRNALITSKDDKEKFDLLRGFAISDDEIRRIVPINGENGLLWTTIIIITTLTPGTAHTPVGPGAGL
tara:strand:+ start:182 stop:502 length:321 start_codon:yes stop_codon:yes gene_type:complete